MESFISQLETLWMTAQVSIIEKVREIGVESEDYDFKVIKTDAARSFNLDSSKWLAEVGEDEIYDNEGYIYSYGVLTHEQLCELADWVDTLTVD